MKIVHAQKNDIDDIMEIYQKARQYMKENGNHQWGDHYPERERIELELQDIYLCMNNDEIAAVFYFAVEEDVDYGHIQGQWLNEKAYGVVHRIASTGIIKGAAQYCLEWAFDQVGNIRIDTYKANVPMQRLLEKCGFQYCGTIYRNEMDWLAYQRIH